MVVSVGFLVILQGRSDGCGISEWLDTIYPEYLSVLCFLLTPSLLLSKGEAEWMY